MMAAVRRSCPREPSRAEGPAHSAAPPCNTAIAGRGWHSCELGIRHLRRFIAGCVRSDGGVERYRTDGPEGRRCVAVPLLPFSQQAVPRWLACCCQIPSGVTGRSRIPVRQKAESAYSPVGIVHGRIIRPGQVDGKPVSSSTPLVAPKPSATGTKTRFR